MKEASQHFTQYLLLADSRELRVLLYLYGKKESCGRLRVTLTSTATACDVTRATVNKVFQKLYKESFLTKTKNGQYQLQKV